jgi:hypothetical protein
MARVSQYIADLATKVANLDHRPNVDKPKPDPHGPVRAVDMIFLLPPFTVVQRICRPI